MSENSVQDKDKQAVVNKGDAPSEGDQGDNALARNIAAAVMKDKEKASHANPDNRQAGGQDRPVEAGNGIRVFPAKKLSQFGNPLIECYGAEGAGTVSGSLVAMLSNKIYPPRIADIKLYQMIKSRFLPELKHHGSISWSEGEMRRCYALFYENIHGDMLMPGLKKLPQPFSDDYLIEGVILPLITALNELYAVKLYHGSIRPNNIYYNMLDSGKTVVLGDCLSTSVSSAQPVLFETIHRGMARPAGKGVGSFSDDIYAFGVTVALLAIGKNPMAKLSDDEIIQRKLEMGSFNAICGGTKPSARVLDMLRGVLVDDEDVRWNIEDLRTWAEGKRHAVRSPKKVKKASRALQIGSREITDEIELAVAMAENPSEGYRLIEEGDLNQWLTRSVGNKDIFERYESARLLPFEMSGRVREEAIVSRVCMALDPDAPIRFQRLAFYPFAVGAMLNEIIGADEDIDKFKMIIEAQLIPFWFSVQAEKHPEMLDYLQKVEVIKSYIKHRKYGNGIERCLYFLNVEAPCQSPILKRYFVNDMASLLLSLEEVAGHKMRPKEPIDQHIGAFIAQKFGNPYEGDVNMVGVVDEQVKFKAMLTILANMQEKANIGPLKKLAGWIGAMIEPAVSQFNNKSLQRKVLKKMQALAENGAIRDMLSLLLNKSLIQKDKEGFFKAKAQYKRLSDEEAGLEMSFDKKQYGLDEGRDIATTIAMSILGLTVLFFLITEFGGKLGG